MEYLPPGEYQIRIVNANGNGKWDTGNYLKIQPRKLNI